MTPSRQRALIALRSFPSVAAAARSVGTTPQTLLRMAVVDDEVRAAYEECVHGVVLQRLEGERDAAKRQRAASAPRVSVRAAERRLARIFAVAGKNPSLARGALHKRLNREVRQEKAAAIEAAIDAVDDLISGKSDMAPIPQRVLDVFDRWCGNCKSHRIDDPCEVCNRKTLLVKGDGCSA